MTAPLPAPTARLTTEPHFDDGDGFYEALIQAHQGLSDDESHAYNARLVLVLANHIGAHGVLLQALDAARLRPAGGSRPSTTDKKERQP
jgi:hypothetical protein